MPQCWIEPWNSDDILSLATTVALTAPKSQQGLLNCSCISTLVSFTATSRVEASGDIQIYSTYRLRTRRGSPFDPCSTKDGANGSFSHNLPHKEFL